MDPRTHALLIVTLDLDPTVDDTEFNRWYFEDHIAGRLRCPGFLGASRFRIRQADATAMSLPSAARPPSYLAIYELEGPEALETPEDVKLRQDSSEETKRMRDAMQHVRRNTYIRMQPGEYSTDM